ncbi:MAG: 4Fe-4S dicluster domain-containing protein [Gammaproteobacteria bacterium]|nr:4Fe-4S dicluster domain-containing protein [Gammaproteobacteria bacterium]
MNNPPRQEKPYKELAPIHDPRDELCDFEIQENFKRFNQVNEIYCRGQWDARIRSDKVIDWFKSMFITGINVKERDGFRLKDFALKNAGWSGANLVIQRSLDRGRTDGFLDNIAEYEPPNQDKVTVDDPEQMAAEMKQVCKFFGADIVGITSTDLRWHYSNSFDAKKLEEKPHGIPEGLNNTIVIGTEMARDVIKTYPSATAGVATGYGYSKDAHTLQCIAAFIQGMGYRAAASLNDTANRIPYAIQAGLGEYGRHGLVITKEFGPRLRFGQIFTDLPLRHDKPDKFGVKEFCQICRRCSDACPPKAIPESKPQSEIINQSNLIGVRKWTVDAEKCFKFWTDQGTECGICIRVCPYNKASTNWYERLYFTFWRWLAGTSLRGLALWLDIKLGFGGPKSSSWWWKKGSGW